MSSDTKIEISTGLLRKLHRIHRQRTDLTGQIARGPRQIKAGEGLVTAADSQVKSIKEALKKATMMSDDKQLQLKSREANIEQLQTKLNSAASNREFDLLRDQIAADKQANSVLSDEILEALDSIDRLETQLQNVNAELKKQETDHQKRITDVDSKTSDFESELDRVNAELVATEKEIPTALQVEYQRVISAKGEDALAPVEDESCGGCYQVLTTQYIDRLRMSVLIRCPNCNAFLYLSEETRP